MRGIEECPRCSCTGDDRAAHYENALRLRAMIPSARLYLINNCGHWAQMEHPEEFNRVVHEFISAH
ncbi:alpha/beta fold hydrolase [Streptomyces regalis]|uniref:AB hydrolase-1 domain-containing protein n=1 Tax=Streptomyces regalis TaxID=68262 RepID=A0A0X3VC10_9ACTN|nr:alpha/beta hydrolase [Streptomyces regalis]KUL42134.1 hypothetical protein ADL12_10180 [Streptomyces regalis]